MLKLAELLRAPEFVFSERLFVSETTPESPSVTALHSDVCRIRDDKTSTCKLLGLNFFRCNDKDRVTPMPLSEGFGIEFNFVESWTEFSRLDFELPPLSAVLVLIPLFKLSIVFFLDVADKLRLCKSDKDCKYWPFMELLLT